MSRSRALRRAFAAVATLAITAASLVACGGGGGGGEPAQQPFAATAAAYWVSGTGSRWAYQRIDRRAGRDPTPALKTVIDAGEDIVDGIPFRRFEHSLSLFDDETEVEHRRFDGTRILGVADLAGEFGLPGPAQAYAEVPAPLVDGGTTPIADETWRTDFTGDGIVDTLRVFAEIRVSRVASLSVPAGDFSDLLSVRTVITGTATDGATGLVVRASAILTAWYAPGVGIVRRVFEDPEYDAPANTITEELVGIDVGGLRGGLQPNLTLLDDIGAGTNSSTPAGIAVTVSGDQVLALALRGSSVQAALRGFDGRLAWSGAVLQAPAGSEFSAVAASFDGAAFRIVAAHRRPFDSPSETVVVAQRLRADGSRLDGSNGQTLDTAIADPTQTLGALHTAARDGRLLLTWGRYDNTLVPVAPGLVMPRGYVTEARLFDAANQPVSELVGLADGLPQAVGLRDDQFMVVASPQVSDGGSALAVSVLSAIDGRPVGAGPVVIDSRPLVRTRFAFHGVGSTLWLAFGSIDPAVPSGTSGALTALRLGRDGALLDGSPALPGRVLVEGVDGRAGGRLALGGAQNLLAWVEGWNSVRATAFDEQVLNAGAALPAASVPLAVDGRGRADAEPSRSLVWTGGAGGGLLTVWLDNEQSASTPSDRITATLWLPRLGR